MGRLPADANHLPQNISDTETDSLQRQAKAERASSSLGIDLETLYSSQYLLHFGEIEFKDWDDVASDLYGNAYEKSLLINDLETLKELSKKRVVSNAARALIDFLEDKDEEWK